MYRAARTTAFGLIAALVSLLSIAAPAHASGPSFYYADAQQGLAAGQYTTGLSANVYIANPYMQANTGEHTLMELGLVDASGNAVEMGWYKDSAAGGPKLFITYWQAGVWCGSYSSCGLYADNTGNTPDNGASLASYASATFPGNVVSMSFNYATGSCGPASAGWFFYFAGVNVGCILPTAFSASGGFTTATQVHASGEVYYGGSTLPCTDMGNGKRVGSLGASGDAYFGSVGFINPNPSTLVPSLTAVNKDSNGNTTTAAYESYAVGTSNRTFGIKGAGYTSTGATPGNTGSC